MQVLSGNVVFPKNSTSDEVTITSVMLICPCIESLVQWGNKTNIEINSKNIFLRITFLLVVGLAQCFLLIEKPSQSPMQLGEASLI
jgi:hypothetical protein